MSETNAPEAAPTDAAPKTPLTIGAQYIKDFSFENPNAPHAILNLSQPPEVAMDVDVKVNQFQDNAYEVCLTLSANAKSDDTVLFMIEIVYAAIVQVDPSLEDDYIEKLLLIETPRLIFPFARAIVADSSREGGYPPLLINPIDFVDLYHKRQIHHGDAGAGSQTTH